MSPLLLEVSLKGYSDDRLLELHQTLIHEIKTTHETEKQLTRQEMIVLERVMKNRGLTF